MSQFTTTKIYSEYADNLKDFYEKKNLKDNDKFRFLDPNSLIYEDEFEDLEMLKEICETYPDDDLMTFVISSIKWESSRHPGIYECDVYYNDCGNLEYEGHWGCSQ